MSTATAIPAADRAASAAPPMPLERILPWAVRCAEKLAPYCVRCGIAGSIRRRRPVCGDIDIVILPKHGMHGHIANVMAEVCAIRILDGRVHKRGLLRKSSIQLDLWLADHGTEGDMFTPGLPPNLGALLLTYTGPVAHNIRLVDMAKAKGWRWSPTRGLVIPPLAHEDDSPEIVSFTERDIYARLGIPWLEPEDRDAWAVGEKAETLKS